MIDATTLPPVAWAAIIALAIVQFSLMILALVKLARTPQNQVNLDRKWLWAIIIIGLNLVGSILFLALGRKPAPISGETPPTAAAHAGDARVERLVSLLYDGRSDA